MLEGDKTAITVVKIHRLFCGMGANVKCFSPRSDIARRWNLMPRVTLSIKALKREVNKRIYGETEFAPVEIVVASIENDAGICDAKIYGAAMSAKK